MNVMTAKRLLTLLLCVAVSALALPTVMFADAPVSIVLAGAAFGDPTPRAPVGGNPGTTLGQQRTNAIVHAIGIWAQTLDSRVPIHVAVQFVPLPCNETSAVLASAGAYNINANFPGSEFPNTWYHGALANKRAGFDLVPNSPGSIVDGRDLTVSFNINLGNEGCLTGSPFYLGFDANEGTAVDIIATALHEYGHGLGFSNFVNITTGALTAGLPDIYTRYIRDNTTNLYWNTMSNAQRVASSVNTGNVSWDGSNVTAAAPSVLIGFPRLNVNAPASIEGDKTIGTASPGGSFPEGSVTGDVVVGDDGVDVGSDACTPLVNNVAGKVVLVDRGVCAFTVKAVVAQAAGAIAVLVAENVPGLAPAALTVGAEVTIPVVRISYEDGLAIKAALTGGEVVNVTLRPDPSRLAGTDVFGRVLLNAPNPVSPGSSISHWDPIASPNLVMEPSINKDLGHDLSAPADLTLAQMRDIGWYADADLDMVDDAVDACLNSIDTPTVVINGCDSGVSNFRITPDCTVSDRIAQCAAGARNFGQYVSCSTRLLNGLYASGSLTDQQRDAVKKCVQ